MNVTNSCSFDFIVIEDFVFLWTTSQQEEEKVWCLVVMAMNTRKRLPSPPNQDAGKERGGCGEQNEAVGATASLVSRSKTE